MGSTYTVAEYVDGVNSGKAGGTSSGVGAVGGGKSLCIHQVNLSHTHPRQIALSCYTIAVCLVEVVAGVGEELLAEIARAAALSLVSHNAASVERAVNEVFVYSIGARHIEIPLDVLATVDDDVVVETLVTILEGELLDLRILLEGILEAGAVRHAVSVVYIVGCRSNAETAVAKRAYVGTPVGGLAPASTIDAATDAAQHSFLATRVEPALVLRPENLGEDIRSRRARSVLVEVVVVIRSKFVWSSARFEQFDTVAKHLGRLLGVLGVVLVGKTIGGGASLCTVLGKRRSSPEEQLALISHSSSPSNTQLIVGGAKFGIVPVVRKELGSLAEVLGALQCGLLNREAREVHSLGCTNQVVNVGKTAHVVQHLGMPPCTEEVELSGDGVLLFIGSIGKEFQVSKAGIALADAVPRIVEYVVSETVVGAMVGTRTIHVGETAAPVVEVCTEVTKVEVVGNVWRIAIGRENLVLAIVP